MAGFGMRGELGALRALDRPDGCGGPKAAFGQNIKRLWAQCALRTYGVMQPNKF